MASPRQAITLLRAGVGGTASSMVHLRCRVRPGASKSREGIAITNDNTTILVCVAQPPRDGEANKAVIEILSRTLGVAKSHLNIVWGSKSRDKTVSLAVSALGKGASTEGVDIVSLVTQKLLSSSDS